MTDQAQPSSQTRPKVLFVDDDEQVLHSFEKLLRNRYDVVTATDARQGLVLLLKEGPFQVVVSDLKMPLMDGVSFFVRVKELSPDTVRILLTGYGDFENAVESVNRGYVFRFLSKPCPPDLMAQTIADGVQQYELIMAGHEQHSFQKLKKLMEGIVEGFSAMVEARDPYTSGHQRRVAELAVLIAKRMGFTKARLEALRIAGMIHDVGKVYIPLDFLNKPGRLKEQEMSVIHLHPEVGADIFKSLEYEWPISDIIRQHHERLDGSGYPDGLSGDDILIEARILAVADVVDAMSSRRPYRDSLGLAAARDELATHAGTKYDAEVVNHMLTLLAEEPELIPQDPAQPGNGA